MRKTSSEEAIIEKTVIDEILCDKCGKSIHLATVNDWVQVEGGEATFEFGYGSVKDGTSFKVELCDTCCDEFYNSLKHKPKVIQYDLFF